MMPFYKITEFYKLPAELLREGVSTDDGQDVIALSGDAHHVYATVYTPSDDPDEDESRRCAPETRVYPRGGLVDLAVFHNSPLDLSTHPRAVKK